MDLGTRNVDFPSSPRCACEKIERPYFFCSVSVPFRVKVVSIAAEA